MHQALTKKIYLQPVLKYTEEELVSLLKERTNTGFSYLYDHYSGALFSVILNIIPDQTLASDVLQEVLINVFRKIESYDPSKSRLYTWMLNIARNEAIDTVRSKGYRNSQQNREASESVYESAGSVQQNVDRIGLRKLIDALKPDYRQVIELAYFNGLTQEEISQMLNMPLGTVKTRLRTALIQLRSIMR